MLFIHEDIVCIVETAIDGFVQYHPQQLQLYNTFCADKMFFAVEYYLITILD